MTTITKNKFIAISKDLNFKKYPGYVCVGYGCSYGNYLRQELDIDRGDLYIEEDDNKLSDGLYDGSDPGSVYYLKTQNWTKLFGKLKKQKPLKESIISRIDLARNYIGMQIKSDGEIYTITEPFVYSNIEEITDEEWYLDHSMLTAFEKQLKLHGNIVTLQAENPDGMCIFEIDSNNLPEIYIKPKIRVNGYDGDEQKDFWVFGCAKIAKSQLLAAKKFLESQKSVKGSNREIESVKIGVGDFTLDILNDMFED